MKQNDWLHQDFSPLAMRMRPQNLNEFVGQNHLLAPNKPIYESVTSKKLHSMILWGPPGSGKTTLAEIISKCSGAQFEKLSAVLAGVKEIRTVVSHAKTALVRGQRTILFVDEVHRFNKAQQDAFLPHLEDGTIILIGATTENPSFQMNNALLSRASVYVLHPLHEADLLTILRKAITDKERGLGKCQLSIEKTEEKALVQAVDGDARQLLNCIEIIANYMESKQLGQDVTQDIIDEVMTSSVRRFDKMGDAFYDQISALHKSVRGGDPDAALYWLIRMLDGGADPNFIARRIVRMASEDVGNADPRALSLAISSWEAYERLGPPEGELMLAQAVVYCASAPKSNAVYKAMNAAIQDVKKFGSLEVPLHLRNAPTQLMKKLDYGKGYRYAHDEPEAFAAGVSYFPKALKGRLYYHPVDRGLEIKIKEKLSYLRNKNQSVHEKANSS